MAKDTIKVHQIKTVFSRYAERARKGARFIIACRNVPFAKLVKLCRERDAPPALTFGLLKGQVEMTEDFNAPLDDIGATNAQGLR